ncbi:Putative thymidylate synthase [Candida maltosa Xu316]|uniref:Putative thymidylate synthase n=1 Tax=Candida maltosa (strain Xu316) TaxID=1245528 RepID=M3IM50_CANMX|nr:Putative thymidylate synthase [Candida maltosa Xu316]
MQSNVINRNSNILGGLTSKSVILTNTGFLDLSTIIANIETVQFARINPYSGKIDYVYGKLLLKKPSQPVPVVHLYQDTTFANLIVHGDTSIWNRNENGYEVKHGYVPNFGLISTKKQHVIGFGLSKLIDAIPTAARTALSYHKKRTHVVAFESETNNTGDNNLQQAVNVVPETESAESLLEQVKSVIDNENSTMIMGRIRCQAFAPSGLLDNQAAEPFEMLLDLSITDENSAEFYWLWGHSTRNGRVKDGEFYFAATKEKAKRIGKIIDTLKINHKKGHKKNKKTLTELFYIKSRKWNKYFLELDYTNPTFKKFPKWFFSLQKCHLIPLIKGILGNDLDGSLTEGSIYTDDLNFIDNYKQILLHGGFCTNFQVNQKVGAILRYHSHILKRGVLIRDYNKMPEEEKVTCEPVIRSAISWLIDVVEPPKIGQQQLHNQQIGNMFPCFYVPKGVNMIKDYDDLLWGVEVGGCLMACNPLEDRMARPIVIGDFTESI